MFLGPASNALAACAPAAGAGTPPAGTTVTCAGTTLNQNSPNGYGDGSQTGITVNVQQAASVTGTNTGILLGANDTVNNHGAVTGNTLGGIIIGANGSVTNSGSVTLSGGAFGEGILINGPGSVINSGSVTLTNGGGEGIFIGGNGSVTNSGSVTITGSGFYDGIFINGSGSVTNSGSVTITAGNGADGIFINAVGGTGSVNNSGSVTLSGAGFNEGIFLNVVGGTGSVINSGSVTLNDPAGGGEGIFVNGKGSVTNSGSVTLSGAGFGEGIFVNGKGSVTNSGSVTLTGGASGGDGIFVNGNGSVANSGSVTLSGGGFKEAIFINGTGSVTNSGSVTLNGAGGGYGIFINGNGSVTNSGSVNVAGTALGIDINGTGSVTNSGSVVGSTGVFINGPGSILNTGTIVGTAGPAIQLGGPGTLTNVVGSRVVGAINLFGGGPNAVNFQGGNWLFTFNTLSGATINTNGAPFVVSGNQVAVLDPTAIALADRSLMFVTGGVSQMLRDRFSGIATGGGGQSAMSFAAADSFDVAGQAQAPFANIPSVTMSYASDPKPILGKAPAAAPYYDTTVWTSGFGGERIQDAYGSILPATETAFGGAIGVDRSFGWDWRLGAFLGGGFGREAVELNVQTVDTDYFFGGVYGHVDWAAQFLNLALYGGSMSNASTRGVANNLVPGGFQSATASYGGWFISPELTYGIHIPGNDFVWTPRIIVRYVGGSIDGFTETGSAQNLSLGAQAINDLEERAEIEFSKVMPASFGGTFKTTADIGVIGLERLGNSNINAVLLGQNLAFVTPGAASAVGLVVGGAVQYRPTPSVALYLSAEGTVMSDNSVTGALAGGARISF